MSSVLASLFFHDKPSQSPLNSSVSKEDLTLFPLLSTREIYHSLLTFMFSDEHVCCMYFSSTLAGLFAVSFHVSECFGCFCLLVSGSSIKPGVGEVVAE